MKTTLYILLTLFFITNIYGANTYSKKNTKKTLDSLYTIIDTNNSFEEICNIFPKINGIVTKDLAKWYIPKKRIVMLIEINEMIKYITKLIKEYSIFDTLKYDSSNKNICTKKTTYLNISKVYTTYKLPIVNPNHIPPTKRLFYQINFQKELLNRQIEMNDSLIAIQCRITNETNSIMLFYTKQQYIINKIYLKQTILEQIYELKKLILTHPYYKKQNLKK